MLAARLVDTPAERVSLLHTVVGILDRAVGLLPEAWAAATRATALGFIAEEQRIDAAYKRLREITLKTGARHAALADIRALERLRNSLSAEDERLGRRRPDDVIALSAALEAHLAAAHQLRLAQDQWMLRLERLRAYQRSITASIVAAHACADAARRYSCAGRTHTVAPASACGSARPRNAASCRASIHPRSSPPIHALFRSASELALNAARLRLDAVEAADLELARQASSAAAGAIMLLARAKMDLDAASRPPLAAAAQ